MLASRIGWTCWALLPIAGLAYHFGPGQRAYTEDKSRDILRRAESQEADAQAAQDAAYQSHLASLKARKAALATRTPEDQVAATAATTREDNLYAAAAEAWKKTADTLQQAQSMLAGCGSSRADRVRVARDRALIRSGRIADGVGDLENLLDTLAEGNQQESTLARSAREEVATGYYYGARLMRVAGKPAADWRAVSSVARQNFRYLAETGGGAAEGKSANLQKNLELVLNLEQSVREDLVARPLPKNSPRAGQEGLRPGNRTGKTKRPPRGKDARGAGGVGDIEGGW